MVRIAEYNQHKSNAELMQAAGELMFRGYVIASGTLARSSLEAHLRRLLEWHSPISKAGKRYPVGIMLGKLTRAHVIDRSTAAELRRAFRIGSRCIHGRPVGYADVAHLLDRVRLLLVTHPINEDLCDQSEEIAKNWGKEESGGDCCQAG